jgi:SAM-dependent methyltransferase
VWRRWKGAVVRRLRRTLAWRRLDWPRAIRNAAFRLVELLGTLPETPPHALRRARPKPPTGREQTSRRLQRADTALLDAHVLPVLLQYGLLDEARRCAERLLASQDSQGAWTDGGDTASLYATGRAIWALLAARFPRAELQGREDGQRTSSQPDTVPQAATVRLPHDEWGRPIVPQSLLERAIVQGAGYLQRHIGCGGRVAVHRLPPGSLDRWLPPAVQLATAAALFACGQWLDEPAWTVSARSVRRYLLASSEVARWCMPLRYFAEVLQALYLWGDAEPAHRGVCAVLGWQNAHGAWPELPGHRTVCPLGQAHLAALIYRFGRATARPRADRALDALLHYQQPSGGFGIARGKRLRGEPMADGPRGRLRLAGPHAVAANPAWRQDDELTATAALLHAAYWRARSAFERGAMDFPAAIDEHDPRLHAVLRWCQTLPRGAHVADIGCGRGRYLRAVQHRFPHLRLTGIDIDRRSLSCLPGCVAPRRGHFLWLPATDGEFDAVLCVEALEHALLPQRAVAELCRVTRPGGAMLIIDKHAAHQSRSCHAPWETWLTDELLAQYLGALARLTAAEPLPAVGPGQRRAVFRCWRATRHAAALHRAA